MQGQSDVLFPEKFFNFHRDKIKLSESEHKTNFIQTGDLKLTKNGFCFYVYLAPDGKISKSIGRLSEKHMVINFINFF